MIISKIKSDRRREIAEKYRYEFTKHDVIRVYRLRARVLKQTANNKPHTDARTPTVIREKFEIRALRVDFASGARSRLWGDNPLPYRSLALSSGRISIHRAEWFFPVAVEKLFRERLWMFPSINARSRERNVVAFFRPMMTAAWRIYARKEISFFFVPPEQNNKRRTRV